VASGNLAEIVSAWAAKTPSVSALTLFGSRVRPGSDASAAADEGSDWDFQIISSDPRMFAGRSWADSLAGARLRVYAPRMTRFGRVPKVNALFEGAEADFVIIPAQTLRLARFLVSLGLHRREGLLRRRLRDLAIVIRPGWRFLKGREKWEGFYRRVVDEVDDARLGDAEVLGLASVFVCDYAWTLRKIGRGELVAAQRMLHFELVETNLRLFHELRLRRGERSFPDGRRIEQTAGASEASTVTLSTLCEASGLRAGAARTAASFRELMHSLVGGSWSWPEGID
jgi:hypothetical protein